MKVIGLCGGSGSGKSIVSKCFFNRGVPSLDTDAVYHTMVESSSECSAALINEFGESIKNSGGGVNRKVLADIVFGFDSENKLKKLNSISHFYILKHCREWLSEQERKGVKAAIIDAPVLFESGFDRECDLTVAVIASSELRIERIKKRDKTTEEDAKKRIKNQADDDFLVKNADYVIYNNTTEQELDLQVEKICRLILR